MTKLVETLQSVLLKEITETDQYIQTLRKKTSTDVAEIILPQKLKCYIQGLKFSLDALRVIEEYYENEENCGN